MADEILNAPVYDDTALENMEIGGRNLLRDSKVMVVGQWALPEGSATYTQNDDYSTITMNAEIAMNCVNTCTLQTIDKKWKDKNIVSSMMVRTTTDDERIPALKTYLSLGFKPVYNHESHLPRWQKIKGIMPDKYKNLI